ncbi:MAG: phage protease [Nitrospirae bacterium]|nr:phage protease [Magnetococcales bacterium]
MPVTLPGMDINQSPPFIAACLSHLNPDSTRDVLLIPSGRFQAIDGRPGNLKGMKTDTWLMDDAAALACIQAFAATARKLVIDYEHQTIRAETNGQPAPAAGWIQGLEWRPEQGLVAQVKWTERAAAMIKAGEYQYISPTFSFDKESGRVAVLHHAGLTNHPALPGLGEVAARRITNYPTLNDPKETPLSSNEKIVQALGLQDAADEVAILSAIKTLADKTASAEAKLKETEESLAALKTQEPAKVQVALSQSTDVPLDVVKAMQAEIATLKTKAIQREVDGLVTQGLKDGRLPAAMESWARGLGAANMEALKGYLSQAQPIAALAGMQTGGKVPAATDVPSLDAAELAVCAALGVDPKEFVAAKATMTIPGDA